MEYQVPFTISGIMIDQAHVDNWARRALNFLDVNNLPRVSLFHRQSIDFQAVNLILSDEMKQAPYYLFTLPGYKEEIRARFPLSVSQLQDLNRIDSFDELGSFLIGIRGEFERRNLDLYNLAQSISEIIVSRTVQNASPFIAGEYDHSRDSVILYYNVILSGGLGGNLLQASERVFAHELFHAYHYRLCDQPGFSKTEIESRFDYTSTVVKESLAAYFEYWYCDYYGIPANNGDWVNDPAIYPYAGAQFINSFGTVNTILSKSNTDMDAALRHLVIDPDCFYDIKNKEMMWRVPAGPATASTIPRQLVDIIEDSLHHMGKGWFILKYAEDNGVNVGTDLNAYAPNSLHTMINMYRRTAIIHPFMIDYLKSKPIERGVYAGTPRVDSAEIERILWAL